MLSHSHGYVQWGILVVCLVSLQTAFCVEVFYVLYINFCSFIPGNNTFFLAICVCPCFLVVWILESITTVQICPSTVWWWPPLSYGNDHAGTWFWVTSANVGQHNASSNSSEEWLNRVRRTGNVAGPSDDVVRYKFQNGRQDRSVADGPFVEHKSNSLTGITLFLGWKRHTDKFEPRSFCFPEQSIARQSVLGRY